MDTQARLDALADAETLADFIALEVTTDGGRAWWDYIGADLYEAAKFGRNSYWSLTDGMARNNAYMAAKMAFRAVPGLRG